MTAAGPLDADCPSCADERTAGAAFCEACGRPLTAAAHAAAPAPTAAGGLPAALSAPGAGTDGQPAVDPLGHSTMDGGGRSTMDADGRPTAASSGPPGSGGRCPACATADAVGADGYCTHCGMLAVRPRDHVELQVDGGAAVTDRGQRHHRNEDAVWLAARNGGTSTEVDIVVCDGVSSSFDPDVASALAVETAGRLLAGAGRTAAAPPGAHPDAAAAPGPHPDAAAAPLGARISAAIIAAGADVAALARAGDPRRAASNPACTIVAACVRGGVVDYGWVGDSRAYWIPATGPAVQLTEDDSWATDAIRAGMDPQQAWNDRQAHAVTAWLGADAGEIRPRTGRFVAVEPGHLLVCSDGLWNYLTDPAAFADAAREHLAAAGTGPAALLGAARSLTAFANDAGGSDNITVTLTPVAP